MRRYAQICLGLLIAQITAGEFAPKSAAQEPGLSVDLRAAAIAPGTIEIVPPIGPVGEEVRILGAGLVPNAPVVVLGGKDPERLSPVDSELREEQAPVLNYVDSSGEVRVLVEVPEDADYGSSYYFALKLGNMITRPASYQVDAREPAPSDYQGIFDLQE